jgi:alpha-beta hydrolase superfamily lysophospholipase
VPVESVEVEIASGDVRLGGTMLMPLEPRGGAVFLNGSGPLDRDSNIDGQRLDVAKAFATALADAGWVSLRFDKRGVGESTGDALTGGFDDETADAAAALRHLRTVVDSPLVVLGHSVGGTIAVRLAARHRVDGVVLLATPAQRLRDVAHWQTERIAATLPGPSWLAPRMFRAAQRRGWRSIDRSTGDTIRGVFRRQPARWFREAFAYDPGPDLAALTCPVLAVTGHKDLQVDAADVAAIGSAVDGPFRGETPDELTHLLRNETGQAGIMSYRRQMKRPVDPNLVDDVVAWIVER